MALPEYDTVDALALAELVRNRDITPGEVVREAIARAERHNPALNAIVFKAYEHALQHANGNSPEGPLAGVPMLLKDMRGDCVGMPTRSGSRLVRGVPADHDCTLVARYKAAGLNPIGKTNVPEFGILPTTEPKLYGAAHNPWDLDRTPGGSSGGSAAAVAAGIVPIAHATDGGGSIRIPASCCGLVGLKVSRGRITQGPDAADSTSGLSVDHVLTRSVRDCATALDISCAPDFGDPYFALPPQGSYREGITRKPKRLRIAAATKGMNGRPFDPEIAAAVERTAKLCQELGHFVEEKLPPVEHEQMTMAFLTIWSSNTAYAVESFSRAAGVKPSLDVIEGITYGFWQAGLKITAVQHIAMLQFFHRLARVMADFHKAYDLWLTPTLGALPMKLGTVNIDETDPYKALMPMTGYVPFTAMQNATGQPAINVPLQWSESGLPIGVQFVGRSGDEMTLLQLAAELEGAAPWAHRYKDIQL
ncbi:MAG TPA: amidase family protein [Rhizomicrobium sp.]|jgi:amidase|nr:amidase family protein [Rhizomicrobium sp.]